MRFLRGLLSLFVFIVLLGGIGYGGWNLYQRGTFNNIFKAPADQSNMNGMQSDSMAMPSMNQPDFNTISSQNMDKIARAIDLINQAVTDIGIDPYSKITLGSSKEEDNVSDNITLYPSGNSSVTITNQNGLTRKPDMSGETRNRVYDQDKLQQVHNGIYAMSQGIALINGLNDDLLLQSADTSTSDQTYQSYMTRYNQIYQNRVRLNNAVSMLTQASTLINVNPYAAVDGYEYDKNAMQNVHTGITKLAEGMLVLSQLNEDFRQQMSLSLTAARNAYANQGMTMSMPAVDNSIQTINGRTMVYVVLIVLIIVLIISILGGIGNSLKGNPKNGDGEVNTD